MLPGFARRASGGCVAPCILVVVPNSSYSRSKSPRPPSAGRSPAALLTALVVIAAVLIALFLFLRRGPSAQTQLPEGSSVPVVAAAESAPAQPNPHLYSAEANAPAEIGAALRQAKSEHKRVLLDFGGNWCGDCQVLDIYLHQAPNAELLARNFVMVHVDIGHYDHNLEVAAKYHIPLAKGVPAMAVLAPDGTMLYSQQTGEFESMRHMDPAAVTAFLNHWKA